MGVACSCLTILVGATSVVSRTDSRPPVFEESKRRYYEQTVYCNRIINILFAKGHDAHRLFLTVTA